MRSTSLFTNVKMDQQTGCWNWTGAKTTAGYGTMGLSGRTAYVHRISAWLYLHGPHPMEARMCIYVIGVIIQDVSILTIFL